MSVTLDARLIVCVGSGGVGKTTTSAAVALRGALEGRRVLVLTIDPAKRLANAMGLESLGNHPQHVPLPEAGKGRLDAMMLDAKASFDALIRDTAGADADRILKNRVYRLMADHFAGVQEYMAVVRLYDLYESGSWDLIVLDTPPAKHAVDFFSASSRAAALFDERIIRWFLPSGSKEGSLLQRVFNPGAVVLKLLSVIGGEQFVAELSEFFEALHLISDKLKHRGERVDQILTDDQTRYIVVASPDPRRVDEAVEFHDKLGELGKRVDLFVLNRSHHHFAETDLDTLEAAVRLSGEDAPVRGTLRRAQRFYDDLLALAERDRGAARSLGRRVQQDRVRLVPVFGKPIHELSQLDALAGYVLNP
ncbi:MAG: anion-transporting ArsA/GET3 family ATPase [Bradymonadia bacterium]